MLFSTTGYTAPTIPAPFGTSGVSLYNQRQTELSRTLLRPSTVITLRKANLYLIRFLVMVDILALPRPVDPGNARIWSRQFLLEIHLHNIAVART